MGQSQSKRDSNASSHLLTTAQANTLTTSISPNGSSHSISYPANPRVLTRLSEIIDPYELLIADITASISPANSPEESQQPPSPTESSKRVIVQSPSGNLLSASEFLERPDRNLTLAERKKAIEQKTRQKIESKGLSSENLAEKGSGGKSRMEGYLKTSSIKRRLSCFCCFR